MKVCGWWYGHGSSGPCIVPERKSGTIVIPIVPLFYETLLKKVNPRIT
jgi:hypothetical protein